MQTKNFLPLRSQRGVTLVEVIVVMLISTMLIMVAALGIGVFFRKFKELSAWAELQKDGWECLNTIKNGISVGTADDMEFIGVTNAVEIKLMNTIGNTSSGVEITTPSNSSNDPPGRAQFYLYQGVVRCTYRHKGRQNGAPIYLFPSEDNVDRMTVEKFQITKLNREPNQVLAIQVDLHARVKTGEKTFKKIRYTTKMVKK